MSQRLAFPPTRSAANRRIEPTKNASPIKTNPRAERIQASLYPVAMALPRMISPAIKQGTNDRTAATLNRAFITIRLSFELTLFHKVSAVKRYGGNVYPG